MPAPTHGKKCKTLRRWRTKCPDCKKPVIYWECNCGSKVFFDTTADPGEPLNKHECDDLRASPFASRKRVGICKSCRRRMSYDDFLTHFKEKRHRLSDEEAQNKMLLWDEFKQTLPQKRCSEARTIKLAQQETQVYKKENVVDLGQLFQKAFEQCKKNKGWADLSEFGNKLIKVSPSFKSSNYGYGKLSRMISAYPHLIEQKKDENNLPIIRIVQSDSPKTISAKNRD
jgi:hypothetical protein